MDAYIDRGEAHILNEDYQAGNYFPLIVLLGALALCIK